MKKVTIVESSDWFGLYIDGILKYENHQIEPGDLLNIVGIDHEYVYIKEKQMRNLGRLTNNLNDLPNWFA